MGLSFLDNILSIKFSIPIIIILGTLSKLFSEYYFLLIVLSSFIISPVVIYILFTEGKYIWSILFVVFIIGGSILSIYFSYINMIEFHTSLLLSTILFISFYSALKLALNNWMLSEYYESITVQEELNRKM